MIAGSRVLGVVAARGGSKGLPHKNVLPLGGKPLIAWSIDAARSSRLLDRTVVSTDDEEIAKIARACGGDVPFLRPAELATDSAPIVDAVLHAVDTLRGEYEHVVLLQATSPLRTGADIDEALKLFAAQRARTCVAMTPVSKGPWWMFRLDERSRARPLLESEGRAGRRQELPPVYLPNGAIFIAAIDWLRNARTFYDADTVAYIMPPERSCDIDTAIDLKLAASLISP